MIGASVGLAARAAGRYVIGWDVAPDHSKGARESLAVDTVATGLDALLAEAETLVIATPLATTVALVERLAHRPPAATLILDVASVMAPVARAGARIPAFIPSHPLAGSEKSGPSAARADLFAGATWAYAPAGKPATAVRSAREFIASLGGSPLAVSPDDHDRIVALTSHLPQIVAVALAERLALGTQSTAALDLCGPGIRSMTRLGVSAWSMWRDVLAANGPHVAQEVRAFITILCDAADTLENGPVEALEPRFAAAAAAVARLNENAAARRRVDRESQTRPDERSQ